MTKACGDCRVQKKLSEFYPSKNGGLGVQYYCKLCTNSRAAIWKKKNPVSLKRSKRKGRLKNYGLTLELYDALLLRQCGGCAICGTTEPGGDSRCSLTFRVDHDHETGKVRGLLCNDCNLGLGKFKDRGELLKAALAYLQA